MLTEAAGKYLVSRKKHLLNIPHVFSVDNKHTRTDLIMSLWPLCYHI